MQELSNHDLGAISGGWEVSLQIGPLTFTATDAELAAWYNAYASWWGDYYSTYGMSNY